MTRTSPCSARSAGVALPVEAHCGRVSFQEAMLFTHRGLSGPAILTGLVGLARGSDGDARPAPRHRHAGGIARCEGRATPCLAANDPGQLAAATAGRRLGPRAGPRARFANLPDRVLADAASSLGRWAVTPAGTEGYIKAEVTLGGVDTGGAVVADDGGQSGPGSVRRGRSRRCDRLARRLQFPVGLVERLVRGDGGLAATVGSNRNRLPCNIYNLSVTTLSRSWYRHCEDDTISLRLRVIRDRVSVVRTASSEGQ